MSGFLKNSTPKPKIGLVKQKSSTFSFTQMHFNWQCLSLDVLINQTLCTFYILLIAVASYKRHCDRLYMNTNQPTKHLIDSKTHARM